MRNDDTQLPPIDPDRQENEEQRNSVWAVVDEVCILEWENFVGKVDRTAKSVPFWPIFVDGQQQDFQPVVVLASTTQHVWQRPIITTVLSNTNERNIKKRKEKKKNSSVTIFSRQRV